MTADFWKDKRVLVTGHTGFKGGWLSLWLQLLGARVFGVALPAAGSPNLFCVGDIGRDMSSHLLDIRDLEGLSSHIVNVQPDCVFHLAAQPLVRLSYQDPVGTFSTNVMGTVHLLEALRPLKQPVSVVIVTSDKCYANQEWCWGYRECDPLGGKDPYSGSKGCAELATASYIHSFFSGPEAPRIATARAGNVVGGGDWSADRLVPDVLRAFSLGDPVSLRYPGSVRPWQHVLEPLSGYLELAEQLARGNQEGGGGWNFGPLERDVQTVSEVVKTLARLWGTGAGYTMDGAAHPHEAGLLKLDCSKAAARLGWKPKMDLEAALSWTLEWFRAWKQAQDMHAFTRDQITRYLEQ